jgi:hypothetical protein
MSDKPKEHSTPKSSWKRWVIVLFCVALIVAHFYYPTVQIDAPTVWLVAIATIAFLLPEIGSFTPYIKRVRIGDTEVELKDEIAKLGSEVEIAQQSKSPAKKNVATKKKASKKAAVNVESAIEMALNNPRATLLLLSARIEQELKNRLVASGASLDGVYSLRQLARLAVDKQILSSESASALNDFAVVRNRVAHGEAFDVEDSVIYSLISIGANLLQIIVAS